VDKADITPELAAELIAAQFPQWAGRPVRRVEHDGWDNWTFRLGDDMSVRLPSGASYALQVAKEHRWLPALAAQLPLPIPAPLARGAPGAGYPWQWSVYRWLPGRPLIAAAVPDLVRLAADLAGFLSALYRVDADGGPPPGEHNFFRGGSLAVYQEETQRALAVLGDEIDVPLARETWAAARAATWHGSPVWVHGDIAPGNLLVEDGRLTAVIDFGSSAVGDPACDAAMAWTTFSGKSRDAFRAGLPFDEATWARGRGWALWKAAIVLVQALRDDPADARETSRVIAEVLADHRDSG
jgi:aminoglycoside phosphotransferase (APT) family kinase protein